MNDHSGLALRRQVRDVPQYLCGFFTGKRRAFVIRVAAYGNQLDPGFVADHAADEQPVEVTAAHPWPVEDEIPKAVKDRAPAVNLNGLDGARSVSGDQIGARVDCGVAVSDLVFREFVTRKSPMQGNDNYIRIRFRLFDVAGEPVEILGNRRGANDRRAAGNTGGARIGLVRRQRERLCHTG